jgi:pyruvate,water dikinase
VLGIPGKHALCLLPHEAKEFLENGVLPRDLKGRRSCSILTINGKTRVCWNREADRIYHDEYERYGRAEKSELWGMPAYKGLSRGKAYLALSENDFRKIPKGSVLVCSMTRYSVTPYLKRVSAIVTDQGGITCHAAIISRELGIPCVIGTTSATKILKNGDYVEVDANSGVVKKIRQKQ